VCILPAQAGYLEFALTGLFSLWHSRKLASPAVFGNPMPHELAAKPPAFHRLVQVAPDGRKTLYLAAHAKRVLGIDLEKSQKLIWELIGHCTQSKVHGPISPRRWALLTGLSLKYVFSMEWLSGGDMVWWDNR
jgi:alpha-ketoglutarate-dependent 2,4-dichlorophenoxyacetate dioxygenase